MRTLAAALVVAASLCAGPAGANASCRAERVESPELVELRCGAELTRVRLANVRAPRPDEIGHDEATRALRELLRARELVLVFEPANAPRRDGDGRLLAQLYDAQGSNLNVAFVELGWASYSDAGGDSRLAANFLAAEHGAQLGRRALWAVWSVSAAGAD